MLFVSSSWFGGLLVGPRRPAVVGCAAPDVWSNVDPMEIWKHHAIERFASWGVAPLRMTRSSDVFGAHQSSG
jgi:hypothetical protein